MLDGRHVLQVGSNTARRVTTTGTGSSIVIPDLSNGNKPKWVWLVASTSVAVPSRVRAGSVSPEQGSGTGSAASDIPLVVGGRGIFLNVWGYSHIHVDLLSGSGGTQVQIYVVPLENQ